MEAIGPLLIVLSLPLLFRWVPRNRIYGFRVAATLRSDSVWYDANARVARQMILLGLLMVALEFILPRSAFGPVLSSIGIIGFAAIIITAWRAANRWERARSRTTDSHPH